MQEPELRKISLGELHFDPENPRLPNRLKNAPEGDVLEYLLLECNIVELMLSIGQQDFFSGEPIMVSPRPEGGFIVVEGNRRLGALKLLQDDVEPPVSRAKVSLARSEATYTPTSIPALIFQTRDEILTYLGYRHITGIQEWDALAKARYLRQLSLRYDGVPRDQAYKALAKEIGSKSDYVAKLLTGLALLDRAEDEGIISRLRLNTDDLPFSLLTTGIGYENIRTFIGLNGVRDVDQGELNIDQLEEFFRWVFHKGDSGRTLLGESRQFDKLARVVNNNQALAELRQGRSLDDSDLLTDGPINAVRRLMQEVEYRISIAQSTIPSADGFVDSDVSQADRILKAARALHASLQSMITSAE